VGVVQLAAVDKESQHLEVLAAAVRLHQGKLLAGLVLQDRVLLAVLAVQIAVLAEEVHPQ
jgi:hypothetical protein